MSLVLVTAPVAEPITIAQARLHLKVSETGTDIDAKIMACVAAAREMAENDTRRKLITQQWKLILDVFPRSSMSISSANWYGTQWGSMPGPLQQMLPDGSTGYELYLPFPPLISVDAVGYIDQAGASQTIDATTGLIVNKAAEPAIVMPAFGTSWPAVQNQMAAAAITFTCGYGADGTNVPAGIKQWILGQVGAMYTLPQAELAAYRETLLEPNFMDRLLDPHRIRRYF